MTPKIYLIGRMTEAEKLEVQRILSMTPLACVVASDPRTLALAREFATLVETLKQPIAILADFDHPLTAINEDGSLCPLLIPSNPS